MPPLCGPGAAVVPGPAVWSGAVYISPVLGIDSEVNDLYNYGQGAPFNNPYITIRESVNQRKTTDSYIASIDKIAGEKEKELMKI